MSPFETTDGAEVARALICDHALVVGGHTLRVEEAEAYFWGGAHRDPFAHRDPVQATPGRWYFHRAGASYRGGSFKGLDLTFGPPGTFGGALIRTLSLGDELIVGPSKCVDRLLALAGVDHVRELDDGRDVSASRVRLRPAPRERAILRTARVGLTLKRHAPGDGRPRWLLAPDRFLTEPRRVSKGRVHTVIALHQAGLSARAIRERTGSTAVDAWLERYTEGLRAGTFAPFVGATLTSGDLAELHGIWTRTHGPRTIPS